ncbi:DNA transposition protein [Nitrospirillum amazonense]|uniref:DNA transposition protein n=1 Tax=Nitrospirillum amazonense TaxID=28077 RepID=UPI002412DC5A|nr:DNA transposition protein [Nitrospirillum amazonense]MDG3444503.1 DNA transposition protein [Nitrospirillum amazonense]
MSPPRDRATLDMFTDWQPPVLVQRFQEIQVRAATLQRRVSLAVAETLKAAAREGEDRRAEIAARMSDWLGETVTPNMLDKYASQEADHNITVVRLLGLIHATGDVRLLQLMAEMFGHSVIENKWLPWVEVGQLADCKDELDKSFDAARRKARKAMRS